MRRIQGSVGVKPIECVHLVKNKWRIRWDVQEKKGLSRNLVWVSK